MFENLWSFQTSVILMSFLTHGYTLSPCSYIMQWILYYFWISSHLKQPVCEILAFSRYRAIRIQSKVIFLPRFLPLLSHLFIRGSIQSITEIGQCLGLPPCMEYEITGHLFQCICTQRLGIKVKNPYWYYHLGNQRSNYKMLLEDRQHDSVLEKQFICLFIKKKKHIWHGSMINLTFTQHSNEGGPLYYTQIITIELRNDCIFKHVIIS